ncbi:MAG: response regulator transcription factor [Bacteroidota bacterium]
MKTYKILIADDHSIVREGIKTMLKDIEGFEIVGEAENGVEAIEQIKKLSPDIFITDISMPEMSGIEAINIIKKSFPNLKTLILTIHSEEEYIEQIFKSGATGCLYKNAGKNEFELAIRSVGNGENYYCRGLSNVLLKDYFNKKDLSNDEKKTYLTFREKQILKLIAEEYSNNEIAEKLFISIRTVETHRKNMMQKLNLESTIALIKYAVHEGIIKVD